MRRALVIIGVLVAGACSSTAPAASPPETTCQRAMRIAAAVDEMSDTVADIDPVIRACISITDLRAASAKYPAAFDGVDPVEFVRNRCEFGGPSDAPLCALVR